MSATLAPPAVIRDVEAAARRWIPDEACIEAGDEYLELALRCYVAAGLSDESIARRLLDQADLEPVQRAYDAAYAFARHCAVIELPTQKTIKILVRLGSIVPCFLPDDPDEVAFMVRGGREQ